MTTEELNDFFVFRDQKSGQNIIRCNIKPKGLSVDKSVFNYCADNDSEVRIPALLYLGGHSDDPQNGNIKNFFANTYRKHLGCHAFIKSTGDLCCAVCFLNLKKVYCVSEVHPISSVYPVFRNTGGPFVMGMLFARSFTFGSGHRTFGRQLAGVQQGSGAVFDIEEDFLHSYKKYDQTGVYGLKVFDLNQPQTPFPNWNQEIVFAIYMCRGARLVVCDDRAYWSDPKLLKKTSQNARRMDRSLFQESSLVIYEGITQLTLGFEANLIEGSGPFSIDIRKASNLFRPQDRFIGSILGGQNRFVIFLGSGESQYNSICWQLMIRTNHSSPKQLNGKVDGYLLAPEVGRILDIQPWNNGFEQIYWRHRYQRLFRSVLNPEPTLGRLDFGIPPEDMMRRILGLSSLDLFVEIPESVCTFPPDYYRTPPDDCDIRKYLGPTLEMSVQRDTWAQLNPLIIYPPPAPPLYPPIWDKLENKLKYFPFGTQIKFYAWVRVNDMEVPAVKIQNQIFVLLKKRTDDYVWETNPKRPSFTDSQQLSPYEYRLGSDYLIYHKTNIKIGVLGLYYMDGPYNEIPTDAKNNTPEQNTTKPISPKPTDTPKEKGQTRPHTPVKGKAHGKQVAVQKDNTLTTQKRVEKKQAAPPKQQHTKQQNPEKKKGQAKNNEKNKHGH